MNLDNIQNGNTLYGACVFCKNTEEPIDYSVKIIPIKITDIKYKENNHYIKFYINDVKYSNKIFEKEILDYDMKRNHFTVSNVYNVYGFDGMSFIEIFSSKKDAYEYGKKYINNIIDIYHKKIDYYIKRLQALENNIKELKYE
jgi:hypothetical protein